MAEKIYPAAKPAGAPPPSAAVNGNPAFPATKAQLYNHSRPVYRPQPRRSRRSCCCCFCLWITFTIVILLVIAAVAGGIVYVLYRPHRPTFSVNALHVNQFNLTSANKLTTKFNLTVTARNPNKKIVFYYDPVTVMFESNGVDVGDGTIAAFTMGKKNTTSLRTVVSVTGQSVEDNSVLKTDLKNRKSVEDNSVLKTDLKNRKSVPLKIRLDTKVKAKIGSFKTKRLPIRVTCDGIKAVAPTGKTATTVTTTGAKCKVDLRIKIWKWTV